MICDMNIYSPRWGHDDTYKLELSRDGLVFRQNVGPRPPIVMKDVPNQDPEWDNLHDMCSMFTNDNIHPPKVLPDLLERLWRAWRNGELTPDQVQEEATNLAEYINSTTRAKPTSEFWRRYF